MESTGGPTGFTRRAGICGEGDSGDTVDTNGRGAKTGAELRHLRRVFSCAVGADSSLIFAKRTGWTNSTEGKGGSATPRTVDSDAVANGSRSTGSGDGLPVGRNGGHALVNSLTPPLAVIFALVPLVPDPSVSGSADYEQQWYEYASGDFSLGTAGVLPSKVVHGFNASSDLSIIFVTLGGSKDRSGREVAGKEKRCTTGYNLELELDGRSRIVPPRAMEGGSVFSGAEVDILPHVNAGIVGVGHVKVDVDTVGVETGRIPLYVEVLASGDILIHGRRAVEATSLAGCGIGGQCDSEGEMKSDYTHSG